MKVAEYKQISTESVHKTRIIPSEPMLDAQGEQLYDPITGEPMYTEERTEEYTEEVPVMGVVYRDMTPEEEAQYLAEQAEMPTPEPTPEERIADLESALEALLRGDTE